MEVFMKRRLVAFASLTLLVCSTIVRAQDSRFSDPIIGTWKQNMEKSTYSPGPPPPKGSGAVRQYAAGQDGAIIAVTFNINPEGLPSLGAIAAARYDGKEYPQHTVATLATSLSSHIGPRVERTISYKSVNRYTVEIVQRQEGVIVSRSTRTVARDGQTMTEHVDFTNAQGQRITNVLLFEKQ
jgi:hypothetical protein